MKPSQFLYQQTIKDQKDSKTQVIKSKGISKPNTSQQQLLNGHNQSTIYSLVNLAIKEGHNEKVLFPTSLISQSSKMKPQVIVNKNTEIARSLKKLKPLSTSDATSELISVGQGKGYDQQLKGPKLQVYLKQLNKLTDGLFKKTQTYLLFGSIEPKINQNTMLCVLRIQKLKFFNDYNSKNHKNQALFFWEVLYRKQSLMKTLPKDYDGAQSDLLDFVYTRNGYEIVEIVLWKVKNNDEKYVGQFDLINEDYFGAKEILDYQKKVISENQVEKEMFKTMKQTKSYIGNVQFQIISFGNDKIPLNKYSGIPGSPKTEEERARHRLIDHAMSGQEYRWYIDENDKLVIQKINLITQEIVAECTLEVVTTECGQLTIIYEQKYNEPDNNGRSRPNSRQMKKQHFDATMALINELDKNGQFTEIQSHLRTLSRQGRLSRRAIEEALYQMGCTANQLLLTECGEFGDCLMDFLLVTDDLSGVLEAMQEIKLLGEDELNLESFSNNLFQLIGLHLRKNTNLKAIISFIKALEQKPEVAILIQNYSYASENVLTNNPPFLQNFNPKNYEHVMVMGKLNKMIEKFKVDSKFTRALKKAHVDAKMSIYFEIPCFPKDLDLDKKAESLQLKSIGQNIMHEIVRRQKWEKSHQIFEKYSGWFFVADFQGITPFSRIIETAPFDVLQSLFNTYPSQLNNIFQQFNPYQDIYIGDVPIKESKNDQEGKTKQQANTQNTRKQQPFEWMREQKEYRKNILHCLILNHNLTTNEISEILKSIEQLVSQSNKQNFSIMKTQKIRAGDLTPIGLYLEILRMKCKKKLDRVQREIGTSLFICQMLIPDQDEPQEQENRKFQFVWDINNQFIIQSLISKLPEILFLQIDGLFGFIQWIPPLEQLKTLRYINLPTRLLIKHKQQQKLIIILQQMYNDVIKQEYDTNKLESDQVLLILYYFQIQILMLLEIRNLKTQHLESVQSLIVHQLKNFIQSYTEILVIPMPKNIILSNYQLKYFFKGNPETLLELLNLFQFNTLITEIEIKNLDRLDNKLLGKALSQAKDKESLKDLIQYLLKKDQNKDDTEKYDYDSQEFSIIINPYSILEEEASNYRDKLDKKQIEKLLRILKADQILQSVCDCESKFNRIVHNLILNSFYTKKSFGITQLQIMLWIRNYDFKLSSKLKQLYIDYFRNKMDLYFIHCLLDIQFPQKQKVYKNQYQLQPYITAQGNSWAAILDHKRFTQALKDNIQFIDIEDSIRAVAINGQYDRVEILIPYLKDPQILHQTIQFVSIIAESQMIFLGGISYFAKRQQCTFEELIQSEDEENLEQPKTTIQSNLNKQELKKLLRDRLDEPGKPNKHGYRHHYTILRSYFIKRFDLIPIKQKNQSKYLKEKWKIDNVTFPEALDQIRTPISTQNQLLEMNSNIQTEVDFFIKQQYPKSEKLDILKFEQQFEKDIITFRYLKNWKSTLQRQQRCSLFSQGYQGSDKYSYKKVLLLLMNEFKRYGVPLCQKDEDYEVVLKMLAFFRIITIDEFINKVVSSNIENTRKNEIQLKLLQQFLDSKDNPIFEQYQMRNQDIYLQSIPLIIKNLQTLTEFNSNIMENCILNEIHLILKKSKPVIFNPLKIYKIKLASEILMRLDQSLIKNQFQDQIIAIAQTIRDRNLTDKILQQFASRYLKEKDQKVQQQVLTHKDIIISFKKKRLDEILQQVDLTYYVSKFSDKNCEEIIKELFKLSWDKKYKNDLLNKFNRRLFESLIFYRRFKTYDTLIHEILFKKICNYHSEEEYLKQILASFESHQIKTVNLENDKVSQDKNIQKDSTEYSLSQMAAQFSFYEYFDTLHRLKLRVKEIKPFPSIRFMLETNDQLQILAAEFEKKDLNYISNCIKMMRYLRLNHYDANTLQLYFENEVMLSFVVDDISSIQTPCLNIIKQYLTMNGTSQPFWQDSLIQRISDIKYQKYNKSLFIKKILEHSLIRLKVNGIEKGVKFCFPSNYNFESNEYSISNDDIRKTQSKKPLFSIDQYIDYLDKNDPVRLEYQIVNDHDFQKILNKLQLPNQNQEFLVDKINVVQFLKQILYHDHEIYYYLLNFPLFWYDQKIPKENLIIYSFFLELELGMVFFKAILIFEPKQLDQVLDIYFYSLMDYARKEQQEIEEEKNNLPSDWSNKSNLEYYEETDNEGENKQELQQVDQTDNIRTEAQIEQISNQQQRQEPPKIKKKNKIIRQRLKDYIEPLTGLRRSVEKNCSKQVQFQVFLQLLLLATTNEESFQLIQKYLIEYQVLPPLQPPRDIDPIVQSRLLEQGYKQPFSQQFIEQIESNINQSSQQQIEDIKHLKEVINFNRSLQEAQCSKMYQLLISQIYSSQYSGFQNIIDKLLVHPAYMCLNKQKNKIFSNSLQNDKQFQEQIIIYHIKNRLIKDQNYLIKKVEMRKDFIDKFFEGKSNQQFTNDKWIHIICLLKYCFELENQFIEFDKNEGKTKLQVLSSIDENDISFGFNGYIQTMETFNASYCLKFEVSNNFIPPIYEYIKEKSKTYQIWSCYFFKIDITMNILKSKNPNNPFPIPQLYSKTYDELDKIFRIFMFDFNNDVFLLNEKENCKEMYKLCEDDYIDSSILKQKLTIENYQQLRDIQRYEKYFLDEVIQTLSHKKIYRSILKEYIEESENQPDGIEIYNYGLKMAFQNPRIQRDIKIQFQDKFYCKLCFNCFLALPFSNYKYKQQNKKIEVDLTFPELYPVTSLQDYVYMPVIITEEESNQKFDSLSLLQSACIEIKTCTQLLNDFLTKLSSQDENIQFAENPQTRNIYWPLVQKKGNQIKGYSNKFKYNYIIESIPLYLIIYLFENLNIELNHTIKFTFNCLSLIEIILIKLIRIIQQNTGKKCKISTAITIFKEWIWFKKILITIGNIIIENDYNKFIAYYVEINEIHPNQVSYIYYDSKAFKLKSDKLEGMDSLFQFGKTQFFVHQGVLIIRLNIALVSEHPKSQLNLKSIKLYQIQSTMFQENKELIKYMQFIVTSDEMLKQIFSKD